MQLGWCDVANPKQVYLLPRNKGEARVDYTRRFFAAVHGVGQCVILTRRGLRITYRAARGW